METMTPSSLLNEYPLESIHNDRILSKIYERSVNKFMPLAGDNIVFNDLRDYIKSQIFWKKQCLYTHGPAMLLEVCRKIGEDFDGALAAIESPKTYRDLYYSLFE